MPQPAAQPAAPPAPRPVSAPVVLRAAHLPQEEGRVVHEGNPNFDRSTRACIDADFLQQSHVAIMFLTVFESILF